MRKGRPTDRSQSHRFPSDPIEIGRARDFIHHLLLAWGLGPDSASYELAVSELVTNAIVHGSGPIEVSVSLQGDLVHMEVADQGPGAEASPDSLPAGATGMGGWGLKIIEGLSDNWGESHEAHRTRVWMERRYRGKPHGTDPGLG
jgi:anti-sigma regulatory factor (Ser/Thr protein kinase)